jgi:hypothetical protein
MKNSLLDFLRWLNWFEFVKWSFVDNLSFDKAWLRDCKSNCDSWCSLPLDDAIWNKSFQAKQTIGCNIQLNFCLPSFTFNNDEPHLSDQFKLKPRLQTSTIAGITAHTNRPQRISCKMKCNLCFLFTSLRLLSESVKSYFSPLQFEFELKL